MPVSGTRAPKSYTGVYDFTVQGGAISTILLKSEDGPIPSGSIITHGVLKIDVAFTTGTAATAALTVNAANDIVSATVVSGAPYSTTGLKSIIPVATGATAIETTADRAPSIVIATGTITAGKCTLILFYK